MHHLNHYVTIPCLATLFAASACVDPDDPSPETAGAMDESTGGAPSGADSTVSVGSTVSDDPAGSGDPADTTASAGDAVDLDAFFECEDPDGMFSPFQGPAFDPETGAFVGESDRAYWASTTQAVVLPEDQSEFSMLNDTVVVELMRSPGLLGVAFAFEPQCGFMRTLALWEDQSRMFAFVASESHSLAMSRAPELSATGKTTSWQVEAGALPLTWETALDVLADVEPSPIYD